MSQPLQIRAVEASDEANWRRLWGDYLAFYQTTASDAVYQSTFARLLADGEFEPSGLLAFRNNEAVGLVHYIQHRTCWDTRNVCYLQDLYCVSRQRGTGVGRALIEAVYAKADALDLANVYWLTHESNQNARLLYDRIARNLGFIRYTR
ncbi:GCN5 family acetyltransferase [Ventosimonas gracilis]|uniref:GCN5 family acetyltransferase n=1 Tax=Ventosimonas gracilis TaxID=1680762 RepID=A0A139SSM3_9GAMM|nr:GNAT family N-acetyltransferase [Ventosimonas gracilis]KXU37573.1 GCN5 family acetyltransferase [Ventosimonas gracilis]